LVIEGKAAFISNSVMGINLPCTSPGGSRGTAAMVAAALPGRSHTPISCMVHFSVVAGIADDTLGATLCIQTLLTSTSSVAVSLSLRDMMYRFAGWQAREVISFTIAIYILSLRRV
jgi:hypothetical protein